MRIAECEIKFIIPHSEFYIPNLIRRGVKGFKVQSSKFKAQS